MNSTHLNDTLNNNSASLSSTPKNNKSFPLTVSEKNKEKNRKKKEKKREKEQEKEQEKRKSSRDVERPIKYGKGIGGKWAHF